MTARQVRDDSGMSIADRLADADLLWRCGRREGALLSTLVAVGASARRAFPHIKGDRAAFLAFMKTTHGWTITVEHRGTQVDIDHLLYKWLRCELVHEASLPPDVRIDDHFEAPDSCAVRAGGAPNYTVLLSPGRYRFLVDALRNAPANKDLNLASVPQATKRGASPTVDRAALRN